MTDYNDGARTTTEFLANDSSEIDTSVPSFTHNLPNEILTDIFLFTVEEWFDSIGEYDPGGPSPAWPISQVCTKWRTTALGYGEIWTFIYVSLEDLDDNIGLYQVHLPRAGSAPLNLHLFGEFNDSEMQTDKYPLFFRSLFTHIRTLNCQVFLGLPAVNSVPSFPTEEGCFRDLTSLELIWDAPEAFEGSFLDCKHLRHVSISISPWRWEPATQCPWSQLTSLVLGGFSCFQRGGWESLCNLVITLGQMTVLEKLGLYFRKETWVPRNQFVVGDTSRFNLPDKVRLGRLRSLSLEAPNYLEKYWLPWLFQRLILPTLEHLTLNARDDSLSPVFTTQISATLQKSECSLRSLCLLLGSEGQSTSDHGVEQVLSSFPTVQTLTVKLDRAYNTNNVKEPSTLLSLPALVQMLELRETGDAILPHLSTLRLCDVREPFYNDGIGIGSALAGLLKSRRSPPIQSLRVDTGGLGEGDLLEPQEVAYMRECQEQGLSYSWGRTLIRELEWAQSVGC